MFCLVCIIIRLVYSAKVYVITVEFCIGKFEGFAGKKCLRELTKYQTLNPLALQIFQNLEFT